MSLAATALLVSAGAAYAQDASTETIPVSAAAPRDLRAENRAERLALGAIPDTRRVDDPLADAAERARARHHSRARMIELAPRLERVDDARGDELARSRHEGALKFARVARLLDKKTDKRIREEQSAWDIAVRVRRLLTGDFDRGAVQSKVGEDERNDAEREKKQESKNDAKSDKTSRVDATDDKRESLEDSLRQRLEARTEARSEVKQDLAADRAADKKVDATDRKTDAAADRKADREADRKDARTDAKLDAAADKKTP